MCFLFWKKKPKKTNWLDVLYSFGIVFLGSIFASFFVKKEVLYKTLNLGITPTGCVFSIVWPVLYLLIALSLYLALRSDIRKKLLPLFSINLAANFIWTFLYFRLQMPLAALIDLLIIWTTTLMIIKEVWKSDKRISYLMSPYFLWTTFAGLLNILSILNVCALYCSFR